MPAPDGRQPTGSEATSLAPVRFRQVLSEVPTSVVVVTAIDEGQPVGMAVGTFTSVSLDPPMVGFLPAISSTSFPRVRQAEAFCANVLTTEQLPLCRTFATSGADKFAGVSWHPAPVTGSPILDGSAAWLDCRITAVHEAGDHFVVIGSVESLDAAGNLSPLVFHRGGYHHPTPLTNRG